MALIFISYRREESDTFVRALRSGLESHFRAEDLFVDVSDIRAGEVWPSRLRTELGKCQLLVVLIGKQWLTTKRRGRRRRLDEPTDWVRQEIETGLAMEIPVVPVLFEGIRMPAAADMPDTIRALADRQAFVWGQYPWEINAARLAEAIKDRLDQSRLRPYSFASEKRVIAAYSRRDGLEQRYRDDGCPPEWPAVRRRLGPNGTPLEGTPNPLPETEIGLYRPVDARVLVNLREPAEDQSTHLTQLEAGPRAKLVFDDVPVLNVGILVSGGIAPGINAVIQGIVNRHDRYAGPSGNRRYALHIRGYSEGFRSFLSTGTNFRGLSLNDVEKVGNLAGSILPTARAEDLLTKDSGERIKYMNKVLDQIVQDELHVLYIIGGDGSMRAAFDIVQLAEHRFKDNPSKLPSIVGIPKTMDNDILWVWQSFGFLSAVDKANEAIISMHTEVTSNPRVGVVQLFGSDSGFVVSHAVLASGVCDLALIPEVPFTMKQIVEYLIDNRVRKRRFPDSDHRENQHRHSPWGMVAMAETAIPQEALDYLDDEDVGLTEAEKSAITTYIVGGRRVRGQTPDELRSAGLKIVSKIIARELKLRAKRWSDPYMDRFRVVTNEPRHLIRARPPSVSDVIFGQRLGTLAVDNAMAGFTQFMVSQWQTEYVLVPLDLVVLGRKRVPRRGIFWKSVLASTGQPASLADDEPQDDD